MANVNAKAAAPTLYRHHYQPITVMSMDLGELCVPRVIECEKGDKWNVKSSGRVRVAPTDFPCYGRAMMKSTALFVPGYQLLDNYDSFRNNQNLYKGHSQLIPWVNSDFMNSMFRDAVYSTLVSSGNIQSIPADPDKYDFIFMTGTQAPLTYNTYKLNAYGRRCYKLFKSLGYDFHSITIGSSQAESAGVFRVNMLPFVAFLKCYTDYFMNVHFYNSSPLVALLESIKHGSAYSFDSTWYNSDGMITLDCINAVLTYIRVPHNPSMYLDSWNSQNSPTGVVQEGTINPDGPISFVNPTNYSGDSDRTLNQLTNYLSSVGLMVGSTGTTAQSLTQLGLNSLYALYQFVQRNNLFGTESAKLAFARFGIKGDDYNSLFVRKLDENSFDIDFSAIMSNSNTYNTETEEGSVLGAYAGFGIGDVAFNFNYDCADYGYIVCINWVQILSMQLHGFDPSVMRRYPTDFYTPEFDGKASRAIPLGELSYVKTPGGQVQQQDNAIFGFTRIYEEYRHMRDTILGDFVLGKARNFVFARDLSEVRKNNPSGLKPQTAVVQYYSHKGDSVDLTDPFTYELEKGDRFWVQILFDIDASRPILSEVESLDLNGEGELQLDTSGNQNS